LTKLAISDKTSDFKQNWCLQTKLVIFDKTSVFRQISDFGQNNRFLTKLEIFDKTGDLIFDITGVFFDKTSVF